MPTRIDIATHLYTLCDKRNCTYEDPSVDSMLLEDPFVAVKDAAQLILQLSALTQGEAKLMLKREESGGLNVSLKQLNAVLRI